MRRLPLLIALTASFFLALPAFAQVAPRVPPANDDIANAQPVLFNVSVTVTTMNESDIETNEPAHSCTTGAPGTGVGSVWYRIHSPGGTLDVNTAGSELGTAVSVYADPPTTLNLAELHALACSAKGPSGSAQAKLKTHLGAGEYFVQISHFGGLLGATDMHAAFSFTPDVKVKGDGVTKPVMLTVGKVAAVKNIQYATRESFEAPPSCYAGAVASSVWFALNAPFTGSIAASAEGSLIASTTGVDDSVTLTAYSGSFVPDTELDCRDDAANSPARFDVEAGDKIWFRLTVGFPTNLFRASVYKLNVLYDFTDIARNGGFEFDLLGWKLKKAANGDGITTMPAEVDAGVKAFKFVGSPNEATSLSQKVNIPSNFRLRNAAMTVVFHTHAVGLPQILTWEVTLVPADGSKPKTVKQAVGFSSPSGASSILFVAEVENVRQIILTFKNKNASGTIAIDDVELRIEQFSALRDAPAGILPLPPAPGR